MATRVELHKDQMRSILDTSLASLRRRVNSEKNPGIKLLVEKDLAEVTAAQNTLSEIK